MEYKLIADCVTRLLAKYQDEELSFKERFLALNIAYTLSLVFSEKKVRQDVLLAQNQSWNLFLEEGNPSRYEGIISFYLSVIAEFMRDYIEYDEEEIDIYEVIDFSEPDGCFATEIIEHGGD